MYTTQKGFTLIELVVVIVLLGILGVTALGKFEDLSSDAQDAANNGVASELSSSAAVNYAAFAVNGGGVAVNNAAACNTGSLGGLFASGTFPTGYTATNRVGTCTAAGSTYTCDIDDSGAVGTTATATLICTAS